MDKHSQPTSNLPSTEALFATVYDELRKLAAAKLSKEKPGQTLQATALVHEAYLKLAGPENAQFQNTGHFFAAAAEAMRRLIIDRAREKKSQKRGGNWNRIEFGENDLMDLSKPEQIVAVSDALLRFATEEPEAANLVKLCVFAGLPVEQAGALLEMSRATAYRHWAYARAWLKTELDLAKD